MTTAQAVKTLKGFEGKTFLDPVGKGILRCVEIDWLGGPDCMVVCLRNDDRAGVTSFWRRASETGRKRLAKASEIYWAAAFRASTK